VIASKGGGGSHKRTDGRREETKEKSEIGEEKAREYAPLTRVTAQYSDANRSSIGIDMRRTEDGPHRPGAGRDVKYTSESQVVSDMSKLTLKRNASPAQLYEDAIRNEVAIVSPSGALENFVGKKTERGPKDKRIVIEVTSRDNIW
jgi:ATP-dependent phosphoenolpyruvate carboxykinase